MAAGGIRSLITGKSDFELVTEGSQFSYFLQEFKARPKFQCQMLPFPFEGTCHYGDTYIQTLPTAGDLLTRIYLKVNLPDITPSVYATSIGNYLFEYAELMINRQVVERYYGEFNQFVQEITVPQIKQPLLSKLSGKDVPNLTGPNTFYIEIPFSLCERGIPMLAVAPGSFEIRIKYRPSREFTFPSVDIIDVVNGEFLMEYVYLGPDEAKYFEDKKRTYLVQQTQLYQGTIEAGQTTVSYPLHFIGPVKELFFYIQNQTVNKDVFDVTIESTEPTNQCLGVYGNGYFLVLSDSGSSFYSSNHGITWVKGGIIQFVPNLAAYGDGYFICGNEHYVSYSSNHGESWSDPISLNHNTGAQAIQYGGGYFVILYFDGSSSYSSNGESWSDGGNINVNNNVYIVYGSKYFMAYTDESIPYISSNHGITWVPSTEDYIDTYYVVYGDGYFININIDLVSTQYYSEETGTWTQGGNLPSQFVNIIYGNGYFLAFSFGYHTVSRSSNHGISWDTPVSTNINTSGYNQIISYGDGYFILACNNGTYYSTDGIVWTKNTNIEHLINLQLMLDGYEVISQDIAVPLYLRGVQPMDFHTRLPTSTLFYIYSFCLDPENIEPTGQLNFGRIQQQILNMNVVESSQPRYVRVYARSYNIFTTEKGIGKLLFNSNG